MNTEIADYWQIKNLLNSPVEQLLLCTVGDRK